MKNNIKLIEVYPIGDINDKSGYLDIVNKNFKTICTINSLIDRSNLFGDELKIKEECIIGKQCPDIYINKKINSVESINYALNLLGEKKDNKIKYIFKNQNSIKLYEKFKEKEEEKIRIKIQERKISKRYGEKLLNKSKKNNKKTVCYDFKLFEKKLFLSDNLKKSKRNTLLFKRKNKLEKCFYKLIKKHYTIATIIK